MDDDDSPELWGSVERMERGRWEDPACVFMVNTLAARGRIGEQMGHREKHISVRSDIRRSLHPIRAVQEVQTDWDWWHQTAALQLGINEKKRGQENNKATAASPFLTHRALVSLCMCLFVLAALQACVHAKYSLDVLKKVGAGVLHSPLFRLQKYRLVVTQWNTGTDHSHRLCYINYIC